jgi:ferredoxin
MSQIVTAVALRQLVDRWMAEGKQVAGPCRVKAADASRPELVQYAWLDTAERLTLKDFIHPANSIKEFFFPRHEKLYAYRLDGKQIELVPAEMPAGERIVIGARPCDAAALPILDHIFNWDYCDDFYNGRRQLTAVVTLACRRHDDHCFCTAIGVTPGDPSGSDAILVELENGGYEVRCLTEKGHKLFQGNTIESNEQGQIGQGPPAQFDLAAVGEFLAAGYERPEWCTISQRCLGCGACAYTCPSCHCFDIIDEGNSKGGARVRNWDACQFGMFTAHASGHNPRADQSQRQRQRIFHKFQIYPDKFGEILCTGCGNCTRNCPVGLGVLNVLRSVADLAASNNAGEVAR